MWKKEMKKTKITNKGFKKSESFKWFRREGWNGVLLQRQTRRRKIKSKQRNRKRRKEKHTGERRETTRWNDSQSFFVNSNKKENEKRRMWWITNSCSTNWLLESKTILEMKHSVFPRVIEAPFEWAAQQEPNSPSVFPSQRHFTALRNACVSSQVTKGEMNKRKRRNKNMIKTEKKLLKKNKWKRCTFETKTIQSFKNKMKNGKPFQRVVKRNTMIEINKTTNHAQNDVKHPNTSQTTIIQNNMTCEKSLFHHINTSTITLFHS